MTIFQYWCSKVGDESPELLQSSLLGCRKLSVTSNLLFQSVLGADACRCKQWLQGLTCEHVHAALHGVAQQLRVGFAQLQQHGQVALRLGQVHLGHVHQRSALNDQELDVQQDVVVAHRLKWQLIFGALYRHFCMSTQGPTL